MSIQQKRQAFQACLLGGALGDALGWPVEFLKLADIQRTYGEAGIQTLVLNQEGVAEITDDTQMTLFTAEGLLRAASRKTHKGISHPATLVYYAYQRWLYTQNHHQHPDYHAFYDGYLLTQRALYSRRAPGNTCLTALEDHLQGTIEMPINQSKGCGGIMRIAPVGLLFGKDEAFSLAAECAAITHGHPSGYLSAGALAYMIASLIEGHSVKHAAIEALGALKQYDGHEECLNALKQAIHLAESAIDDVDAIRQLGQGWVGEEALAISVFCALKYSQDFKQALIAAVNHDGDSDSTGAITGNLLGAALGMDPLPADWLATLEMKDLIMEVADDLYIGYDDSPQWQEKYPGW